MMEEFIELLKNFQFTNTVWVLMIPVSLMGIDVLTGYLNAWLKHDVKSYRMRQGLVKKCGEILVLLIGKIFEYGLGLPSIIMNAISFYIILMELVSVIENLDKIGVPIPKFLKKGLHQMSDSIQNDDIPKDKEG
jgi:toxin secretion/phage lysis holin